MAAKRHSRGAFRAQQGIGEQAGGLSLVQGRCAVVSELRAVVLDGIEPEGRPLSTHALSMTWRVWWTRDASWRARWA